MVLIRSPSSTYFDHILVSGSRQPRSPGTCSIHTSKIQQVLQSPSLTPTIPTRIYSSMPNPGYWFHRIVWTAGEKNEKNSVAKAFHYAQYLGLLDFWPVPCPKMCRAAERSEAPAAVFFARPTLTRGASAPQTLCSILWQTVHIGL